MAGSSNQGFGAPCPHFDGENYDFWCVKMETQLDSNDVWVYVEDGYDDHGNVDNLTNEQKQQLKKHKRKDARALSMIQQGVSDKIFPKIINERKAKGAWDILQQEYGRKFRYPPTTIDPSQHRDNPMHRNLYEVVKDGRVEDLDQYTDLFDTQLTPNNNTILHVAAHFGKSECVAKILETKRCLLRRVNANCENPLHIAVRERHHGIVEALIECGRELDRLDLESASGTRLEILRAINVDGDTALHLAVREGDAEIVRLLVAEDPDFQHPPNKAEETPLYLAVERGKGDSLVESILASSTSPTYTGPSGRTALHAAVIVAKIVGKTGGYDGNQGPEQGMAVLVRRASFKAFAVANTIAVMCSTSSVVYYVFAAFHYFNEEKQGQRYEKAFYLVLIAIVAMTVGFISGTYAMLVHSLGLAIATSIIASITFLIYFLELRWLFELWYFSMFPWQGEECVGEVHSWPAKMLAKILGM